MLADVINDLMSINHYFKTIEVVLDFLHFVWQYRLSLEPKKYNILYIYIISNNIYKYIYYI